MFPYILNFKIEKQVIHLLYWFRIKQMLMLPANTIYIRLCFEKYLAFEKKIKFFDILLSLP